MVLQRMSMRRAVLQCGPQPWPAEARKHPAFSRRAPQAAPESQALCHSERSEESFPLRTKGRLRTMPCKEEKDKRSAVKNLFGQGCRCFAALNMTVAAALRKEENDKRSAVKNLYAEDTDSSSLCSSE